MTPTVANLNPAISLFLTNLSTPTHLRIRTCAPMAKAVGTTTISGDQKPQREARQEIRHF